MYFWDGLLGPVSGTPDSYIVDRALPLPERALIERIRRRLGRRSLAVVAGIGDDCAVLRVRPGHQALVTTDLSLEGIHFRREWHPPESVGHRCLARGLSDIAAIAIGKCIWSGVETVTASILLPSSSKSFRKSWKRGTSGNCLNVPAARP